MQIFSVEDSMGSNSSSDVRPWLELVVVRLQLLLDRANKLLPGELQVAEGSQARIRLELDALGVEPASIARVFANALVDGKRMRELSVPGEVASRILALEQGAVSAHADPPGAIARMLLPFLFGEVEDDATASGKARIVGSSQMADAELESLRQILSKVLEGLDRGAVVSMLVSVYEEEISLVRARTASAGAGGASSRIANRSSMVAGGATGASVETARSIVIQPQLAGDLGKGPEPVVMAPAKEPPSVAAPPVASWTWLPPDPLLPAPRGGDWVSEIDGICQGEALTGGRFVAAAVRGRGHKQDALYCDDSFSFLSVGEWRILVVSDGAGSAKFSRVGSERACAAVQRHFERALRDANFAQLELKEADLGVIQANPSADPKLAKVIEAFEVGFAEADQAVLQWVEARNAEDSGERAERQYIDKQFRGSDREASRQVPDRPDDLLRVLPGDCNCTLLVCAYTSVGLEKSDGSKRRMGMVVSCAIGDGMIAVFRRLSAAEPRTMMLMAPDTGQFAGQTQFLSSSTASAESVRGRVSVRFAGSHDDVLAVAAMSDGVADDYYEGEAGMERLYCDLVLNGLLPVSVTTEAVSMEQRWIKEALKARAAAAEEELASLEEQLKAAENHAERFKIEQRRKVLQPRVQQLTLESLVVEESVLCRMAEGEPGRKAPLKYASRYCDALALTPRQMLGRPALLQAICSCVPRSCAEAPNPEDPSNSAQAAAARVQGWLDTYIVRGSFDDRTLALLEMVETP